MFVANSWVVPNDLRAEWEDAGLGRSLVERETMYCRRCCASLRVRRLTSVILEHYAAVAKSAVDLVQEQAFGELRVAEINSAGALHSVLARHPQLSYSEFREDEDRGQLIKGVRNEDVCALTYADDNFDLVVTADTLEHVPDYRQALREIRRVLKAGGRHVFTVPAMPSREETRTRARVEHGKTVFLAPPQYHGRGSGPLALAAPLRNDFLTYHDFGIDLLDDLRDAGFEPELHFYFGPERDSDAAFVFCALAV